MGTRMGKHCRTLLVGPLFFGGAIAVSVVGGSPPTSATTIGKTVGVGNAPERGTEESPASLPARRIGQTPLVTAGAESVGALAGTTPLRVDVELLPDDSAALAAFANAVSTPGNTLYKHYITPSQFTTQFGPTTIAVSAVEKQLAASGLTSGESAPTTSPSP